MNLLCNGELTKEQLENYLEQANKEDSDTYIYKVVDRDLQKVIGSGMMKAILRLRLKS